MLPISSPVRELYFCKKKEVFKVTTGLPDTEEIKHLLRESVTTSEFGKYFKHDAAAFKALEEELTYNMRGIFRLDRFKAQFDGLAKAIEAEVDEAESAEFKIADAVKVRHVEAMVGFVSQLAKTPCDYISVKAELKKRIVEELGVYYNHSPQARKAVTIAYENLAPRNGHSDLLELAKKQLLEIREGLDDDSTLIEVELTTAFEQKIRTLQQQMERSTLPYAIFMSHKDIADDGHGYRGFKDLCVYLRLTNCSIKRFIKNIIEGDFDGTEFVKGWSFDAEKPFAVVENVSLSAKKSLSQMVKYSGQSSYNSLLTRLKAFIDQSDFIDGKTAAQCVKQILKTGSVEKDIVISKSFEAFLTTFTYHLFGTEVQRHPAAAVHNAMGIDLIINGQKDWDWVINHLPMALENACSAARFLQVTLRQHLLKPYFYNRQGETLTHEDFETQSFIVREKLLTEAWLESRELPKDINDEGLQVLGILCEDFYGINVMA